MVLLLYALLFRRGRLAAFQSKWLLFLGVCVAPFPVMILSSAVGLDQAKAVAFCKSCHVMRAFVADMEDPGSKSLAALHFHNRYIQHDHCYTCHTDYGLFGTVEAKIGGLTHVWRETAGTYRVPVKTKGPYKFTICLNCHGESRKFMAQKAHKESLAKVLRGETTCTACHGPSHPTHQERG
jgi:cytochrome c nitrite reductase small subunit